MFNISIDSLDVGQSAASADLQMIKSLEDWLLDVVVVLPVHRDLNRKRIRNLMKFSKGKRRPLCRKGLGDLHRQNVIAAKEAKIGLGCIRKSIASISE